MTRQQLKEERERMGMNIGQMARRLNTPRGTYVKWENGERRVPGFLDVLLPILGNGGEAMNCEAYWTCCGVRHSYSTYRCTKCGGYTKGKTK